MNINIYDIDWRKLTRWMVPHVLRTHRMMSWMNALVSPSPFLLISTPSFSSTVVSPTCIFIFSALSHASSRNGDGLKEIITDLVTEILAIYAPKNVANIAAIQLRINQLLKPA